MVSSANEVEIKAMGSFELLVFTERVRVLSGKREHDSLSRNQAREFVLARASKSMSNIYSAAFS